MKEITLGRTAGMRAAETLHVDETTGRLCIVPGDWLDAAVKRKAKYLTRKNGFSEDESKEMDARGIAAVLSARYGYDASKAKGDNGEKRYLNSIVSNAFKGAAAAVADQRREWNALESLDAPIGDEEDGLTRIDLVTAPENPLRIEVALVMNGLPPRLRRWCQKVLDGYSPADAYRSERYSKSNFYAYALPQLRAAFAHLRDAV